MDFKANSDVLAKHIQCKVSLKQMQGLTRFSLIRMRLVFCC